MTFIVRIVQTNQRYEFDTLAKANEFAQRITRRHGHATTIQPSQKRTTPTLPDNTRYYRG